MSVGSGSATGPPGAGAVSVVVNNAVQWTGSHSYDVLTISSSGEINVDRNVQRQLKNIWL